MNYRPENRALEVVERTLDVGLKVAVPFGVAGMAAGAGRCVYEGVTRMQDGAQLLAHAQSSVQKPQAYEMRSEAMKQLEYGATFLGIALLAALVFHRERPFGRRNSY